jgi:ankyrin repeat protein
MKTTLKKRKQYAFKSRKRKIVMRGGTSELFNAAINNNTDLVKLLIKNGADVNDNSNGVTPLYAASRNGNFSIVKILIENGADVNKANNDGFTPLFTASHRGYLNIVKLF